MDTTGGYLKFLGVIAGVVGGMLLVGFIFKWLGMLHIYFLIWEVVLRAMMLGFIALVAWIPLQLTWKDERPSAVWFRFIVLSVALLGAAAAMTFWERISPGF